MSDTVDLYKQIGEHLSERGFTIADNRGRAFGKFYADYLEALKIASQCRKLGVCDDPQVIATTRREVMHRA